MGNVTVEGIRVGDGWYGVRCVFKIKNADVYEERITLWHAPTFDAAIDLAERDAEGYAQTLDMEYLGLCQAYSLPENNVQSGSEVFSLMRKSAEDPKSYVRHHFDTGTELQKDLGHEHLL